MPTDGGGMQGREPKGVPPARRRGAPLEQQVDRSEVSAEGGHVPYRNHPLTMLMSDSVGGSAKTMMLVCSSPAHANVAESVSSFQFATRCKDVVCGSDPRAAAAEIAKLKAEVARLKGSSRAPPPNRPAPNVAPRGPATLAKRHSRRNG